MLETGIVLFLLEIFLIGLYFGQVKYISNEFCDFLQISLDKSSPSAIWWVTTCQYLSINKLSVHKKLIQFVHLLQQAYESFAELVPGRRPGSSRARRRWGCRQRWSRSARLTSGTECSCSRSRSRTTVGSDSADLTFELPRIPIGQGLTGWRNKSTHSESHFRKLPLRLA